MSIKFEKLIIILKKSIEFYIKNIIAYKINLRNMYININFEKFNTKKRFECYLLSGSLFLYSMSSSNSTLNDNHTGLHFPERNINDDSNKQLTTTRRLVRKMILSKLIWKKNNKIPCCYKNKIFSI